MNRFFAPAFALLATAGLAIAVEVKSGLEKGESPAPFMVKDVTGPSAGKTLCYRCQYGAKPTAVVFTREITPEVANLIHQIDASVGANKDKNMCAFVVLLTNEAHDDAKKLAQLKEDMKIENVPLTTFNGTVGPDAYKLSKDAAVTVMMWNKSRVQVNQAFADAKISEADAAKLAEETKKILE